MHEGWKQLLLDYGLSQVLIVDHEHAWLILLEGFEEFLADKLDDTIKYIWLEGLFVEWVDLALTLEEVGLVLFDEGGLEARLDVLDDIFA